MDIMNITEIKKQDTNNTQSYNNYIRELLIELFNNLYSDYFLSNNYVQQKRNDLDLLYKLKNEFYRNYSSGYKKSINYYIKHLKAIKELNPSLKNRIKNIFSEVEENRNFLLDNWEINFNNFIENYYQTTYNGFQYLVNNSFLSFVREHFINNWNMDYFRKNYDIIVKDIFFESDLIEAINSLSSDIKVTYKNNKDDFFEENSDPMISENNENNEDFNFTIKELNDILIKIEDYQYNEIGKSIFNLYENELKNFSLILEANISFEGTSELNNFISIFEDLCDYAYNDSFIDSCRSIILSTSFPTISEEEIDNFTKSNIEMYSTILKDLYIETNKIYEDVYPQLNQYIETMFADINKAFGKLGGFTIIDGFNYIEEPCKDSNCSYSISFPSFKDIVNQESEKKNGRRLEEKDYIGELRETISEMKKILHKSKDFRIFKSSENNESSLYYKRKLEFEFYNKEEKYTSKSGAREETHVNLTISKFKSNTGTLVNKLYYGIQGMEKYLDFSFISMHLNSLRNKVISDFLPYLKGILENENDYYLLEDMIMKSLNKITNIFSDILILLIEKKKNRNK